MCSNIRIHLELCSRLHDESNIKAILFIFVLILLTQEEHVWIPSKLFTFHHQLDAIFVCNSSLPLLETMMIVLGPNQNLKLQATKPKQWAECPTKLNVNCKFYTGCHMIHHKCRHTAIGMSAPGTCTCAIPSPRNYVFFLLIFFLSFFFLWLHWQKSWRYDRKQGEREGEWHAAKAPRPGVQM